MTGWVRFTGWYVFCGTERHGMLGTVMEEAGELALVREFVGWFRNGEPAFALPVPLLLSELEPVAAPEVPVATTPTRLYTDRATERETRP